MSGSAIFAGSFILAIDQGTTGSTALVLGLDGTTLGRANCEFPQHFPKPGWVEHQPEEIFRSVVDAVALALERAGLAGSAPSAIGITNQRETTLLWDRKSGECLYPAIVWQDRRTSAACAALRPEIERVRRVTGLVIDPYFSGTKIAWILDNVPRVRERALGGQVAFGTMDSYLVWRLTGGAAQGCHITDVTNASRTLLMDLESRTWSPELCELFGVPEQILPRIVPSAGVVGRTAGVPGLPDGIPIAGLAGDQHAALFGQACFEVGDAKCTYGTGAFVLANTGARPIRSRSGLLATVAWQIGDRATYALEGSAFVCGAAVQWLRDGLGILGSADEIEALARSVPSSSGVVFVPALAGLGAPHWDPNARGLITGITRGTTRAHLARATLEAMALEVQDLLQAMAADLGRPIASLRVDGGAVRNDLLMQIQADVSQLAIERPTEIESTARGAAMLAGVGVGLYSDQAAASAMIKKEREFLPSMSAEDREELSARWREALARASSEIGTPS